MSPLYFTFRENRVAIQNVERKLEQPPVGSDAADAQFVSFEFCVQRKVEFMLKPLDGGPSVLYHEREDFGIALHRKIPSFSFNSCLADVVRFMFSLLEINGSTESLVTEISSIARDLAKRASESKMVPLLSVDIMTVEVYDYDEEETIAMAARESAEEHESRGYDLKPASRAAIEGLQKGKFTSPSRVHSNSESDDTCRVCLEVFEIGSEVVRMPCSHCFHGSCITKWLEVNHVCPVCRFEMPVDDD